MPFCLFFTPVHFFSRTTLSTPQATSADLPPLEVIISRGEDDVVIKVADKAGGFSRAMERMVWTHGFVNTERADVEDETSLVDSGLYDDEVGAITRARARSITLASDNQYLPCICVGTITRARF
jgi:hypothetical protein